MNTFTSRLLLLLALSCCSLWSQADVLQVRGSANPGAITGTQNTTLNLQWQVFADAVSAAAGVTSPQGQFIDPRNNTALATQVGTLAGSGVSPLGFAESVVVTSLQIQQWRDAGLSRVLYKRTFTDPASGSSKSGAATISLVNNNSVLSRELSPDLVIQRLSLHFNDLQSYALVQEGSGLNATLTVEYRGQGLFNGRWLWAYDDGSESNLQYRTLQIVKQNLAMGQRFQITSPSLATQRSGRYRVRFCLATATLNDCAEPIVEASYQVVKDAVASVPILKQVSPTQGSVSAASRFQWPVVEQAVVYQLQLFRPLGDQFEFVTGMWLPAGTNGATLSPLVRSKLQAGSSYVWRLVVFDQNGNQIARSEDAQVVWQP